jgi:translation elongation factor EF-Tu-like GTPase
MTRRTVGARVHLLPTSEGGRSDPLLSGYRSLLRFEGGEVDFGFEFELDPAVGPSGLSPGASGTGRISFWAVEELPSLLDGQRFELREGARVVGTGTIVEA